jgi:anti-sigma B factor antagonist
MTNRLTALGELRQQQRRFVTLCHRFQASRIRCAAAAAHLAANAHLRAPGVPDSGALVLPLYSFVRTPHGGYRMVRRPRISGGSGKTLLHCWIEPISEASVVHVEGEVDLSTAPWLADTIASAFEQGRSVIVDLSAVSYLDGSGISVLKHAAEAHASQLAVAGSKPQIRRLLEIVHVTDVIPLVASLDAGREYLRHRH